MMTRPALYSGLLSVVIAAVVLTVIFAPSSAAIAIPVYASVAVGVMALLQGANAAQEVKGVKLAAEGAAELVKEVAVKQEESSAIALETREVSKATHVMVNNNMLVQLELTAELSRWKATHEPTPDSIAAADRAETLLAEHRAKQITADATIPRAGFGAMPGKTPAEESSAQSAHPTAQVDVQEISPQAARAIADAMSTSRENDESSARPRGEA